MTLQRLILPACLLLAAACTPTPVDVPRGWAMREIANCCMIALPPGATLVPLPDAIDDPSFILRGAQFEGMFTLTAMGSALPPKTSGNDYNKTQREIGGRMAYIAAYKTIDESDKPIEKRSLLWIIEGTNDGTGKNLLLDYSCSKQGCAKFDLMINTLTPN